MEPKRVGHVETPGSHVYATSDDAFISLRYAPNLSDGHGLVYNPGEQPVEGIRNLLLSIVATALLWAGAALLWVAKGIGVASFAASLVLLPRLVRWHRTGHAY